MNRTSIDEQQRRSDEEERTRRRARARAGEHEGHGEREGFDMARLREVGRNLGMQVGEQARKRPYVALGAAAGVGFVAGSLFGSRLGQMLLAAGLGYFAKNVLEGDIGERLQDNIEKIAHERMNG
ncbi:MAG TPA: hypothetical protein VE987_09205 [Polyangiaceae bacterium]|nr:hypothetical protein [Polyangiaceae bacterium]